MNSIVLHGCTPEPLMSYLKALGIFRLVAEQLDATAKLSWHNGFAVLHTKMDREGLISFFLEKYAPTPVVTPWNGGGGFQGSASDPVEAIKQSRSKRVTLYQETIARIECLPLVAMEKDRILECCRNELPDEVLQWLDTCYVLSDERISYFPLLGTGGNDGRLEFANNFMQRLGDVLPLNDDDLPKSSRDHLVNTLFADNVVSLNNDAIGQFGPGNIGGANGAQGRFEASSRVNPWEYVLMIEGALLFAGSVTRRMNSSGALKAVYPFCVETIAVGYGSANTNEETMEGSRAELWLPLWKTPASYPEIRQLFSEGRAQLGRKQAKNTVEFALAVSLLGVSRGVSSFARYGFLKRNGLAYLATPLGRFEVTPRPQASLLDDPTLLDWLDRLRRSCSDKEKTPSRYLVALRGIDQAIFAFANRSEKENDSKYLAEVMRAIGRAERTLATAGLSWLNDKQYGWKVRPLFNLREQWFEDANDGSVEFRLAASLAASTLLFLDRTMKSIREFIEPVEVTKYVNWNPSNISAVWGTQTLERNIAAIFRRCLLEANQHGGSGLSLKTSIYAGIDDVIQFIREEIDNDKLSDLIWGLLCADPPDVTRSLGTSRNCAPFEFGVPRLVVRDIRLEPNKNGWQTGNNEANAKADQDVFALLATGRKEAISEAVTRAAQRLKAGGLIVNGYSNRYQSGKRLNISSSTRPERLLAAMLFPLTDHNLTQLADSVLYLPESEE